MKVSYTFPIFDPRTESGTSIQSSMRSGFTLVELLVSVAIFALMTALVVAKYGAFNQSIFLTNLAYDVALTVRTAQTYGLSVKSTATTGTYSSPTYAYGVTIGTDSISCAGSSSNATQFLMFTDIGTTPNAICDAGDTLVSTYALKRGATVYQVCAGGSSCTPGSGRLDVTFKRPDPKATICFNSSCTHSFAQIVLKAPDGTTKAVEIRSTGQISVTDGSVQDAQQGGGGEEDNPQ